jgi:hypothetical protein
MTILHFNSHYNNRPGGLLNGQLNSHLISLIEKKQARKKNELEQEN